MNLAERLVAELEQESEASRTLLARLPDGRWDWRPHPKSMSLSRLATHVAEIPGWSKSILMSDEIDFTSPEMQAWTPRELQSKDEILAELDEATGKCRADLLSMTDEDFGRDWSMRAGEQVVMTEMKYMVFRRQVMNHLVHHRGQLEVYLRLLEVPLPMIYGPTADDEGEMQV